MGLLGLLRQHEGAGNPSTLFGHSQRSGGPFAGVDVSKMTIGQLRDFSRPDGDYGQWVKGQVGRVATPMGFGQIVGTTMRNTADALGLPDETVFDEATQSRMVNHLASQRLRSATTPEGKRAAMRSEWEGFKNVSDAELDRAIADFEQSGGIDPNQAIADDTMRALGRGPVYSTAIGGQGADTMDTPRQGLLGQLARPDEKVGGLLGMMFGNMSPDRADQLRANLGGLQGINNQGMVDAARGRMAARSGARESDLNYNRQQQQVEQERAREAQRTAQAQEWIAQNAPPEIAAAVQSRVLTPQQAYVAMQGGKKTESEMKIARLMEDGLSRDTAIGIVDGRLVVSRDPTTQEATIIDKATGKVVEGSSTQSGTQEPNPYEDVNAGDYSPIPDLGDNAGDAFGVEGTVKGAINKVAGAAGLKTPFEDVQEVSNNFAVFNESLLSDLSNGYQRQPPVIIMKALQDLLPKPGQVFEGAGGAQSKLNALEVSINTEKSVVERSLSRKQSPTNRQENEARLDALNAALARVSAMKETFGASGANSTSTGVGWKVVE
jgi:hypothetical protein